MSTWVLPDLKSELNPEQYRAATTTDGPLLVLAGAGSGKTRVLVFRIAHILAERRAAPWQILAVTFTNKAAGEMRERLEDLVGPPAREAWIGTFHALSARILRVEGHRLGYNPNFSIYDADDAKRVLKSVMTEMNIDIRGHAVNLDRIRHEIDQAKNAGLGPKAFAATVDQFAPPARRVATAVYFKYQEVLRQANAMDFGDLVRLATELLAHHPEAFKRFGRRFRYVMVDEFQDTNKVQYSFLHALTREHHNLMVVGDDDQSIYRWRGADVAHILGFEDEYPEAEVVKLEQNYRSSGHILTAANAVIAHNRTRHKKALFTDAPMGEKISLALVDDSQQEAALIAESIKRQVEEDGKEPYEHAILFRMNAQSRLFEESLRRAQLPYRLVGGTGFYDRKEVKDVLAYLRLLVNPQSRQDFDRVVNLPPRGIGTKSIETLRTATPNLEGLAMLSVSDTELQQAGLRPAAIKKLRAFKAMMDELSTLAQTASAVDVAQEVMERVKYTDYLHKHDAASAEDRIANIEELVNSIAEYEVYTETPQDEASQSPLVAYLEEASLASGEKTEGDEDGVQLLTLHGAKGLEFPIVYLVGLEEKTFPSARAVEGDDPGAIEEERRLCYVGMTRAMEQLYITLARRRMIFGRTEVRVPSRFVGELPDQAVGSWASGSSAVYTQAPRPTRNYQPTYTSEEEDFLDIADDDEDPNPFAEDTPAYHESANGGGPRPGAPTFHKTFGPGKVVHIDGTGPKARIHVQFADGSTRTVIAKYLEWH